MNRFFIAWSQNYSAGPIQTQVFALDARQERQYADLFPDANLLAFARANPGRLYINSDEPDQWCITPSEYADIYHDFVGAVRSADPTARFSPAGVAEPNYHCCPPIEDDWWSEGGCHSSQHGLGYAEQFYTAYVQKYGVAPPVDEWRFHDFGVVFPTGDMDAWWARIQKEVEWSVAHGANMFLGAWGFIGWRESDAAFQEHMKQAMGRILNDKRIKGAAYWTREPWVNSPHYLVNEDGSLTAKGQTFVDPLTDVPAAVTVVPTTSGAQLQWSNTTSAWGVEAEFWVQARGTNTFAYRSTERLASPGSVQSSPIRLNGGDAVRGRVRYYNDLGQAAWSSFSGSVTVPLPPTKADQKRLFRNKPFVCLLQSC